MWVDVIASKHARTIPKVKLEDRVEIKFELRIIIWEAMHVPLVDGVNHYPYS